MSINERVKSLRKLMEEKGIDAYIVPTYDPHQSEYIADCYKTREWISGFTGSAGAAVVTMDEARLWTDGRYFIQAEKELAGSEFQLMKMATPGYPTYQEWLKDKVKEGMTIGFDGRIYPESDVERLKSALKGKDINFSHQYDLVGKIWSDRPGEPKTDAFVHKIEFTGFTAQEKIEQVRELFEGE